MQYAIYFVTEILRELLSSKYNNRNVWNSLCKMNHDYIPMFEVLPHGPALRSLRFMQYCVMICRETRVGVGGLRYKDVLTV